MSQNVQNYLANAAEKAASDLLTAYNRLPEDKRNWAPAENSRSAANQVAECALINGGLAGVLENHTFDPSMMAQFSTMLAALVEDVASLEPTLKENTAKLSAKMRTLSDADLEIVINMPWGPRTISELIGLPFWNMTYHEGQINYIASIVGCL